jgi:hypothetical protein
MQVSEQFSKVLRGALLALLAVLVCFGLGDVAREPQTVYAQNAGTVGIQAQLTPVFSAQSTTASSGGVWQCGRLANPSGVCAYLPDIGQGVNILYYCDTNFVGTIDLDWSPGNNSTFTTLTSASYSVGDNGCHTLTLNGYWPQLRSTATVSGGTVTAYYSANSGPVGFSAPAIGSHGATSPVVCDNSGTSVVATGTGGVLPNIQTPTNTVVLCGFTISFGAAPTAGLVELGWSTSSACGTPTYTWAQQTTANSPQIFSVPYSLRAPSQVTPWPCFNNTSGALVYFSYTFAQVQL